MSRPKPGTVAVWHDWRILLCRQTVGSRRYRRFDSGGRHHRRIVRRGGSGNVSGPDRRRRRNAV